MQDLNAVLLVLTYLGAMIITAPIARKLGLGGVLGYLGAGIALGPHFGGLLNTERHEILHVAELGVIMMLFLIGLELRPSLLWKLRGPIFGIGGLQVLFSSMIFTLIGIAILHQTWQVSLCAGLILSLSSTAIVLQTLQEKGLLKTDGGETSLSVLLFQDLAVVPILALFPLIAGTLIATNPSSELSSSHPLMSVAKTLGAVGVVFISGRYLINPIFGLIARAELRELFTALALFLVISSAMLMTSVGLSAALGAFLAGVVLAESEYRHQLEADIEPFKGLLLAIFFISIGADINFSLIATNPQFMVGLVLGIVLFKGFSLLVLGRFLKMKSPKSLFLAFALAQGGEFGFVLLNYGNQIKLFDANSSQLLTAAIALSMATTPLLLTIYQKWIEPKFSQSMDRPEADTIHERNAVIIAGFGRFGQMVARLLRSTGIQSTVLDYDIEQVEILRKFGMKAFYGDASRMDLLHSAGAKDAKLLILAIDDQEKTLQIVDMAQKEFPNLKIIARAFDRIHAYELIHRGIENVEIETSGSALNISFDALKYLGFRSRHALRLIQSFKRQNDISIRELAKLYHEEDEATYISHAKNWLQALEDTMKADFGEEVRSNTDRGWGADNYR